MVNHAFIHGNGIVYFTLTKIGVGEIAPYRQGFGRQGKQSFKILLSCGKGAQTHACEAAINQGVRV